MARAAGEGNAYLWKLQGTTKKSGPQQMGLPSVTHIQKSVRDIMGFGGMAWWGYRVGMEDYALQNKLVKNDPVELLHLYETTKTDSTHTPNTVRDEAGGRGTEGHDILEELALGLLHVIELDGVIYLVEDGDEDMSKAVKPTAWNLAAAKWWLANEGLMGQLGKGYWPERSVWSLKYGYQGTLDLCRQVSVEEPFSYPQGWPAGLRESVPPFLEVIDYKSHKPASGARKDGSYREGEGPAYIDDLIQLQAYARAVWELGLGTVVGTRVVLLGADGEYREDTRTVPFDLFLQLKAIHDDPSVCKDKNCRLLARAYAG